ncbi:hypothetical protein [Microbacterium sp. Se63.02b]|uniref:hypothetical protein n=1 Tax=Microbacterium sp. Se63.02b TaxID=2709304 RepID=UPI0016055759|nr:hypothetical protein [Microbacterium sp. Se63.02b]QNA92267.1 hypothetical protein G4G29_07490 [Microbacterium sp. Se63.02b]
MTTARSIARTVVLIRPPPSRHVGSEIINATAAGSRAVESAFGNRTPHWNISSGNVWSAPDSTADIPAISGEPVIARVSQAMPRGQRRAPITSVSMFAATGMLAPLISTMSETRACHAAG